MKYSTHLSELADKILDLSDTDRINYIRSPRWIGYPIANQVLDKLETLLNYPKSHRMPNLLVVGDTNNGKTMLVQRFCNKHKANDNPGGDGVLVPVLYMQAPPVPEEGRFYSLILEQLFAPFKHSDRVEKKQTQVLKLLRYIDLKILIIDEVHHLLAGSLNKQRAFLNVIKFLGNELQIPIIAVGTKDAYRALQTDPQLANRFEPIQLPKWDLNNDFLRLLASFEKMLPLKNPSILSDRKLAGKIYTMAEGYIGEVSHLLVEAAVKSITTQVELINSHILDKMDWVAPSDRRYQMGKT